MSKDQQPNSIWSRIISFFRTQQSLQILPYRSFANANRIFLKGRVLRNPIMINKTSNSKLRGLWNSFKRFGTREVPNQKIQMEIGHQQFSTTTDREGYFKFEENWILTAALQEKDWIQPILRMPDTPTAITNSEVFIPPENATYGVISDVDDTILQTHVNSLLRLRLLYATFVKHAHQRLPVEGIVELFQQLSRGKSGQENNPFFYVSNSPWNLYDLLEQFMDIQQLPKGPILLRDFGLKPAGPFSDHKLVAINRILEMYPDLPFLLFGDTASKDADHYLEFADRYPEQIKAIYIRFTKNTRNARRVKQLIENRQDKNILLVHSSEEIRQHAQNNGLL
jgi:phosphatidate phosphatase APP1